MKPHKSIPIPPKFFLKEAMSQYSRNTLFRRLIGEMIANSLDAKATVIDFHHNPGENFFTVTDNGMGMDQEKAENGLLTFGGSVNDPGSIGGFGQGKFLIIICQDAYEIRSNNIRIEGKGQDYVLSEEQEPYKGTWFKLTLPPEWPEPIENIQKELEYLIARSTVNAAVRFNGKVVKQAYRNKITLKTATANITENPKIGDYHEVMVRVNGLYTFQRYNSGKQSYFYDIIGESKDVMTHNRESFQEGSNHELEYNRFVNTLSRNTISGITAQAAVQRVENSLRVIDKITCMGDEMPAQLKVRHKSIYGLAKAVGGAIGIRIDFNNFGLFFDKDGSRGLCAKERIWINPLKHEGDDWELDCISTILHETIHLYKDMTHSEYFIFEFAELWKKMIKDSGVVNNLVRNGRIFKAQSWPKVPVQVVASKTPTRVFQPSRPAQSYDFDDFNC